MIELTPGTQEIITYAIIALVAGIVAYRVVKNVLKKRSQSPDDNCSSGGCCGCSIASSCEKKPDNRCDKEEENKI